MNAVDIIILIIIGFGALVGFKRGFIRQLVSFFGFFLSVILAFSFKGMLSQILFRILPFFTFKGPLAGVSVLNILFYEVLSFLILLVVFLSLLQILIYISKILERIIKLTLIFILPSKIGGMILGAIENYVVVFVALYILSFPMTNIDFLKGSTLKTKILHNTPLLSNYTKETTKAINELDTLKEKYKDGKRINEFNLEALNLLLKYKITNVESIDKLVKLEKLKIDNIDSVLSNYR
ncbi:MAG: CvpA family protein [Bacilli bacterium]